jgi:hypothetical protein
VGQSRPLILALALACCGGPKAPAVETPIALPPLVALVPAAGLDMVVDARPRELLAHAELLPLLALAIPEIQFRTFAARHGGVDPRQLEELVVATYGVTTLALGEGDFDPVRLEHAFSDRTTRVALRVVDRPGGPLSNITRLESATDHVVLALFGRRAVGIETHAVAGRVGPLRVSELFAMKRLARAKPALEAPPLDAAARAMGNAPVRIFFPGPFEDDAAKGLAGLLRAATAVAISIFPVSAPIPSLDVTVSLFGAWNEDAPNAGQRFAAAIENISRSDLGRLCSLHEPIRGPDLATSPTILTVSARIDARKLAAGARAATGGQIDEIMNE